MPAKEELERYNGHVSAPMSSVAGTAMAAERTTGSNETRRTRTVELRAIGAFTVGKICLPCH
jgi:hypothetical protein